MRGRYETCKTCNEKRCSFDGESCNYHDEQTNHLHGRDKMKTTKSLRTACENTPYLRIDVGDEFLYVYDIEYKSYVEVAYVSEYGDEKEALLYNPNK